MCSRLLRVEIRVPRYFFDIHDGRTLRDDEGIDLAGPEEAARHAKTVLPEIAAYEVPKDGEHQAFFGSSNGRRWPSHLLSRHDLHGHMADPLTGLRSAIHDHQSSLNLTINSLLCVNSGHASLLARKSE